MNKKKYKGARMLKGAFCAFMGVLMLVGSNPNVGLAAETAEVQNIEEQNSEAQELKNDNTVAVVFYYIDGAYEKHVLGSGHGVLVGDLESGAAYVVTNADTVEMSAEEQDAICEEFAIADDDRSKMITQIEVYVTRDVTITASIKNSSQDLNMAVLQLSQAIYDREPAVFNLDADAVTASQTIYAWGNAEECQEGVVIDQVLINGVSYIQNDILVDESNLGGAIVNEAGELLGMCQNTIVDTHSYALSVKEIAAVLKALGVPYMVADHTDYTVDTAALSAAIEVAKKIDLSGYTDDSVINMQQKLLEVEGLLTNPEVTQEQINQAYTDLTATQDQLQEDESLGISTIIAIIVAAVFLIVIIGLIIFIVWERKKRKKTQREKEEYERKKAPVNQGPYVPDKKEYTSGVQFQHRNNVTTPETATPSAQLEGFAPSSTAIRMNTEDTTILGQENYIPAREVRSTFIREKNKERVFINNNPFIFGKSASKANYTIDNSNVSREHAMVEQNGDSYFLTDLGSTNGTYLNGMRLEARQQYPLKGGDAVRMADEIFSVVME